MRGGNGSRVGRENRLLEVEMAQAARRREKRDRAGDEETLETAWGGKNSCLKLSRRRRRDGARDVTARVT